MQKTIAGVVTKYVYDGWNVVRERDSKNKVTANMLAGPGLDQWLSRIPVTGSASYYLSDAIGSTVGLADPTGSVATSYTYEPFGKTTVAGTSNTNPFRFTGREEDSTGALSLYHYRARYYSPSLQRFLTEDPIGFAGGDANLYGYAGNSPMMWRDARGTCSRSNALSIAFGLMSGSAATAEGQELVGHGLSNLPPGAGRLSTLTFHRPAFPPRPAAWWVMTSLRGSPVSR